MSEVLARITDIGVIPVIVLDDPGRARPLANALASGGLPCAEVTFRTPRAAEALAAMARDPRLLVGAGTVLTTEQVTAAAEAGARYVVTPGYSRDVVHACLERGIPVIPGVATPTEIQMALQDGITLVKFFPAEAIGGPKALLAISAPFGSVRFIPTGGISQANLGDYLSLRPVAAVGGSWMAPPRLVADKQWADISELAAAAVAAVRQAVPQDTRPPGRRNHDRP